MFQNACFLNPCFPLDQLQQQQQSWKYWSVNAEHFEFSPAISHSFSPPLKTKHLTNGISGTHTGWVSWAMSKTIRSIHSITMWGLFFFFPSFSAVAGPFQWEPSAIKWQPQALQPMELLSIHVWPAGTTNYTLQSNSICTVVKPL